MARARFFLFAAAALAGGCSSVPPQTSSAPALPVAATPAGTYRLGSGVIERVALLPAPLPGERASASAGGSIPPHAGYRLAVRMEDGSLQVIDQNSNDFQVGDRVRITGSGRVIRM